MQTMFFEKIEQQSFLPLCLQSTNNPLNKKTTLKMFWLDGVSLLQPDKG